MLNNTHQQARFDHRPQRQCSLLGGSGGVVNSLHFCPGIAYVPWLFLLPVRTFFTMEGGDNKFAVFTLPTLKKKIAEKRCKDLFFPLHSPSPFAILCSTSIVIHSVKHATPTQKSTRKWLCDLSRLLARKITKGKYCEPASPNRPMRPQSPAWQWSGSSHDSQSTHAIFVRDSAGNQNWKAELEARPRLACVNVGHPTLKTPVDGNSGVRGNHRTDRLAGKAIITSSLRLRRSEILRNLKHKGIKPRPSHYRSPEGERCREMKRSEISLEVEKTRAGHRQYEHCFKGRVGETSERRVERIWTFSSAQIPSWTELNWTLPPGFAISLSSCTVLRGSSSLCLADKEHTQTTATANLHSDEMGHKRQLLGCKPTIQRLLPLSHPRRQTDRHTHTHTHTREKTSVWMSLNFF